MTLGKADIHSTGVGFLLFGYGYQHLYFKPRRENAQAPRTKEIKVLDYTQTPSCFLCPQCGTFVLPPGPVSGASRPDHQV